MIPCFKMLQFFLGGEKTTALEHDVPATAARLEPRPRPRPSLGRQIPVAAKGMDENGVG